MQWLSIEHSFPPPSAAQTQPGGQLWRKAALMKQISRALASKIAPFFLQEMFEEYWNAARQRSQPGKTFRLQIWLYKAEEDDVTPEELEFSRSSNHSSSSGGMDASHAVRRHHTHSPNHLQNRDVYASGLF